MFRLLSFFLALLVAVAHAAEPERLRSIAEGLTRTKGDFVFESLPKPSNASFDSVEVSARTEKGLRLEGFLTEFPTESFEAGAAGKVKDALNGGNGRSWVDRACARRCGIEVVAEEKKPAAAAGGAPEKKKP